MASTSRRNGNGSSKARRNGGARVRYAVVGLGHIAQVAMLPGFARARRNSELAALVSQDRTKLDVLGRRYRVPESRRFHSYDECLASGEVDAVYIALPNNMHREHAVKAARAGVHVLCEKPMAVTAGECRSMIEARDEHGIRMMIAYRLHFEAATLRAVELATEGRLGRLRIFNSLFTMQVEDPDNIRLQAELGGGPLYDIGIYCINAARMLFRDEPEEVVAWSASGGDDRFDEVHEMVSAILRYPDDRLASFTCSFGAADSSAYDLIGAEGSLRMSPAYEYAEGLTLQVKAGGRTSTRKFARRDQFAAQLLYFSDCVLEGRDPEPSAEEGLADVRIIEALRQSCDSGVSLKLGGMVPEPHPTPAQRIDRPATPKPPVVHASSPKGD